jgi:hypothetical protein
VTLTARQFASRDAELGNAGVEEDKIGVSRKFPLIRQSKKPRKLVEQECGPDEHTFPDMSDHSFYTTRGNIDVTLTRVE